MRWPKSADTSRGGFRGASMNYLVCMLMIALVVGLFLLIIARVESGRWATEEFTGPHSILRELLVSRRA